MDQEQFFIEGQLVSPNITELSLSIDSCEKWASDPATECESASTIKANINKFYVNYIIITQVNNNHNIDGSIHELRYEIDNHRINLAEGHNLVNQLLLQKNYLTRSTDYIFGTVDLFKMTTQERTFYKAEKSNMYNAIYDADNEGFKGYMNIYLTQSPNIVNTHSTPNNLTEILAVLGGFVTLVTKFIGWGIKSYQIFQYRKSSVKKLYYYTRTKKKETLRHKTAVLDTENKSSEDPPGFHLSVSGFLAKHKS